MGTLMPISSIVDHGLWVLEYPECERLDKNTVVRPKIYARGTIFWIRFYDQAKGGTQKRSLGIEVDVEPSSAKDWWKRSKHRDQLVQAIQQVQTDLLMKELGLDQHPAVKKEEHKSTKDKSLFDLLMEYNEINQLERGKRSKETLAKRAKAINYLLRFDSGLTVRGVSRERVLQLRSWSAPPRYKPSSVRGYFVELKALFNYAIRIKLITDNPFDKITIELPRQLPVRIRIADQYKLFRFIYQTNRPLFFQAMFQRFTGIRVSDVAKLKWEQLDTEARLLRYWNSKKNREEDYPLSDAVFRLFEIMGSPRSDGRMFEFRHGKTVADYLSKACEFTGVTHFASHQLKRDYANEVGKHKTDPRTYDALLHHEPTVNVIGRKHYDGQQYELMLECLNAVQAHWLKFLNEVLDLPQLEEKYAYSNPRVKHLD